jgi:hypothetical protein
MTKCAFLHDLGEIAMFQELFLGEFPQTLNFLKVINCRVQDCDVLSIVSLLGATRNGILEPARAESIIDALHHAVCGSMGKLLETSVFSLITFLSCFSVMGSRDAINVFIPLFFDGLERFLSRLPSDSPVIYTRIGVFLSAADSCFTISIDSWRPTFIYPPTSSNLRKSFSIGRRRRKQASSH